MRAAIAALALPVLLSACALGLPPVPQSISLSENNLRVRMSDGHTCHGPRAGADDDRGPAGWSGRFSGCAVDYRYEVQLEGPSLLARTGLDEFFVNRSGESVFYPRATVRVEVPGGRVYAFPSPPPID